MTSNAAVATRRGLVRTLVAAVALACNAAQSGAQRPALVRSPWVEGTADRGIGVVDFRHLPDPKRPADTLTLQRTPGADGVLFGYWVRRVDRDDQVQHAIHAPMRVQPNLLEYGYEISGLPIDSVTPDGRWARVLLGTTPDKRMVTAWTALDSTRTQLLRWNSYLVELGGVYLVTPNAAHFAKTPNGARLTSPLVSRFESDDHWLEVLERRGEWIRVRLTQPADVCGAVLPKDAVRTVLWVRYLDAQQRPLVWFYNRGC